MDLREVFARRATKVEQLRNFIVLYGKKRETINELQVLKSKTDDVQALLQQCSESVEKFQAHNKQRYLELIQRTKDQQCVMLNVLEKLDEMDERRKISPPPPPPPSVFDVRNLNILKENNNRTPKSAVKVNLWCKWMILSDGRSSYLVVLSIFFLQIYAKWFK